MRGKLFGLIIAAALILVVGFSSATIAAPQSGVDIVVTTGGTTVTISNPGCLNYDGGVRNFNIVVKAGFWVSNGFDPSTGWVTMVSNGIGNYHLAEWRALHICGGSTADGALTELGKVDPNGLRNPRVIVNPAPPVSTATSTATRTAIPMLTATATRVASPTATATSRVITMTPMPVGRMNVVVTRNNGIIEAITDPGCLNYDGMERDFRVVAFNGAWVSNGFSQPINGPGYWLNKYGQERAIYTLLAWSGYHVCAGRDLDEALTELGKVDPNALSNTLYAYPFEHLLFRAILPVVLK